MLGRDKVYLLLIVLLAAQAMAIGIAPGEIDANFGSNKKVLVINNQHKDMQVAVYAEGELAEYIEISEAMLSFTPDDDMKEILVTVNNLEGAKPGKIKADLIAIELPSGKGSGIAARQAVISSIVVNVPYPGKYAEAELKLPQASADEALGFAIEVKNLGGQDISSAKARVDIYSPTNELLASLQTTELVVKTGETRELVARYASGLPRGKYYVKAELVYDGNKVPMEGVLEIGNMLIELKSIYAKDFRLGEIAKFDMIIESKWNEELPNVYADLVIKDEFGKTKTTFKTSEISLAPLSVGLLNAYWDTHEITPGDYQATVMLHFLGDNVQKTMSFRVREDAIEIDLMPTAKAVDSELPTKRDSFIIVLIVLSILINAAVVVYFMRRKNAN
jgi:hypothetical protein